MFNVPFIKRYVSRLTALKLGHGLKKASQLAATIIFSNKAIHSTTHAILCASFAQEIVGSKHLS